MQIFIDKFIYIYIYMLHIWLQFQKQQYSCNVKLNLDSVICASYNFLSNEYVFVGSVTLYLQEVSLVANAGFLNGSLTKHKMDQLMMIHPLIIQYEITSQLFVEYYEIANQIKYVACHVKKIKIRIVVKTIESEVKEI